MPPRRRRSDRFGYDFPADPSDVPAWDQYVRSRLTTDQRALLSQHYRRSHAYEVAEDIQDREERERWRTIWEAYVLNLDVEIEPAGRGVLRPRRALGLRIPRRNQVEEVGVGFRVEIDFEHRPEERAHAVRRACVIGEGEGPDLGVDLWACYTAFRLYAAAHPRQPFRPPRRRPRAGHPLDERFYRSVLAIHDDLKVQGHPAPAAELAKRMDTNPATVRSWVYRGRRLPPETGREGNR
jgi:hypothetical protein